MTKAHIGQMRQSVELLVIATLIVAAPLLASAQTNPKTDVAVPATLQLIGKAVFVQVDGTEVASGFLWKTKRQVVTSLHTFLHRTQDPPKILVRCSAPGSGAATVSAHVIKTFDDADLALLALDKELDRCDLFDDAQISMKAPAPFSILHTFGFYNGAPSGTSREMKKGQAESETLGELLGRFEVAKFRLGIPNLSMPIYYVDGGPLPGYSGAPVVDARSRLVGIVDGGLDNGATGYNWIIPAGNLKNLEETGSPKLPPKGLANLPFFSTRIVNAAPLPSFGRDGQAEKKKYLFIPTKTRTLGQLTAAISDRDGLTYLMTYAKNKGVDPNEGNKLPFDLYEDINKNLVIGIPAGQTIEHEEATPANARAGASEALRTQAATNPGDGTLLFQELPTSTFVPNTNPIPPAGSREFLSAAGEYLLRWCGREFTGRQCEMQKTYTTPSANSPNSALLKFSILVHAEGRRDILEYKSLAVRGATTFYAAARVSLLDNGRMNVSQLASLAAVEIANFGGAAIPTAPKIEATVPRPNAPAPPMSGRLAEGKTATITVPKGLTPDQAYEIFGECDAECDDLDLAVFENHDKEPLEEDDLDDDVPHVDLTPDKDTNYSVRITMASCSAKECKWTLTFDRKIAPISGRLAKGRKVRIPLPDEVTSDRHYEIWGGCEGCDDLDLAVFKDQDKEPLDSDSDHAKDGPMPLLYLQPQNGSKYFVEIAMKSCSAKDCKWTLTFDRK
jgi:hypothetical protein